VSTAYKASSPCVSFAEAAAYTLENEGVQLLSKRIGDESDKPAPVSQQKGGGTLAKGGRYHVAYNPELQYLVRDKELNYLHVWFTLSSEGVPLISDGERYGANDTDFICGACGLDVSEHDAEYFYGDGEDDEDPADINDPANIEGDESDDLSESVLTSMKNISEAPIETGEFPDYIPSTTRRHIEREFKLPSIPQRAQDAAASRSYQASIRKLARHVDVRNPRQLMGLSTVVSQAMQKVAGIERGHARDLEQMAIDLVLSLPEFAAAKEAAASGHLLFDVKLTAKPDLSGTQSEPDEPGEEEAVAEIAAEMDSQRARRRFFNMLIQGNATAKLDAFNMVATELNAINPELVTLYSLLTAAGRFGYWVTPDEMAGSAMGSGEGAGGSVRVEVLPDGRIKIHAQGVCFPLLVHELVKGLMEFLSHDEDMDGETRAQVNSGVDTLGNETTDIRVGPEIWQVFVDEIGPKDAKVIPYVYDLMVRLPADELNTIASGVLTGDGSAKAKFAALVAKAKNSMR
jgi:hypothetical protein